MTHGSPKSITGNEYRDFQMKYMLISLSAIEKEQNGLQSADNQRLTTFVAFWRID